MQLSKKVEISSDIPGYQKILTSVVLNEIPAQGSPIDLIVTVIHHEGLETDVRVSGTVVEIQNDILFINANQIGSVYPTEKKYQLS